jgi:hypothetical protein
LRVAVKLVGAGGVAAATDGAPALVGVATGAAGEGELPLELHAANSTAKTANPAIEVGEFLMCHTSCHGNDTVA